jgi:hypothetical protein
MPREITDVELLRTYIAGVMDRAAHHADEVSEVALTLIGAVIWRKDDEPLEVFERQGNLANALWVRINGVRYSLSYKHEVRAIELRVGSTQGKVVHSFSNRTPASEVKKVFAAL